MAAVKKGRPASKLRQGKTRGRAASAKPRRRSREDILTRIIEAATDEFNRFGYAATTTAAVASNAGVTEAQLFRYFASKSNLFRETVFNPLKVHFETFLAQHFPEGANDRELYTTELTQFIREHAGAFTSLIFSETYRNGSEVGVSGIDSLRTYFERGATLMSTHLGRKPRISPQLFVRLSFVAVLGCVMFKEWIFPPNLASDAMVGKALSDFISLAIEGNTQKPVAK